MTFHGLITKTTAWEIAIFNALISYGSLYSSLTFDIRWKGDHKGVFFNLTVLSVTVLEVNIYSTEHEHSNP